MSRDDENYRNMDQQQFDRRREEDEARQDALLDQIHGGVVGLKNQAHAINDEVVEQNVIIDDIGGVCFLSFVTQGLGCCCNRQLTVRTRWFCFSFLSFFLLV